MIVPGSLVWCWKYPAMSDGGAQCIFCLFGEYGEEELEGLGNLARWWRWGLVVGSV